MTKLIKYFLGIFLILFILTGRAYAGELNFDPEARLKELQITLPIVGTPKNHVEARRMGNMVYISGQVPADKSQVGKISDDAQGLEEARTVGLALIASLKAEIGDLRKVKQIVKMNALINTADGAHSVKIADAVSDLLISVFGDKGKSARFVMGVSSNDTTMEADMIVEIKPTPSKNSR